MEKRTGTYYIFNKPHAPLTEHSESIPMLMHGELLVKITYATLCGSDLHTYAGLRQEPCPTILGHEIVGIVEEIEASHTGLDGAGVPINLGDTITWTVFASDPTTGSYSAETPQKNTDLYKYGHRQLTETDTFHGGLATHIILRAHTHIRVLPKHIPLAVAATINCAIATAAGAIRLAGDMTGKNVLISGMGLLGLTAVAMCNELGAAHIVVTDIDEQRLTLAKEFGASIRIIQGMTKSNDLPTKIDRFIDMSGSPDAMELGIEQLHINGCAVFVGAVFKQRKTQIDAEQVIRKLLTIKGLHNYNYTDFSFAVDFMIAHGHKYPFARLIEKEYTLQQINDAFSFALHKKPIRAGIKINNNESW
ncbi:zinc-binding dehydrogenase [Sphingobacterium suaedae]|uniref:Zinc-binding dehydrogenase n=1 Tax=Sphingobacterium suaedae TaxID=1686402 RepID=A0ABW5KJF9_9SPHI